MSRDRVTPPARLQRADFSALVARARSFALPGERRMIGIVGAPGAGKSTLAAEVVEALGEDAALVSMDGFHLAEAELHRLGIHDRKGAIDTFDTGGYVALLRRLDRADEPVIYAPLFRRDLEESIAGSIPVASTVPLVITEGNYLLAEQAGWSAVRDLLDDVWYLEPDGHTRMDRLITRHMAFGRDRAAAEARSLGSDQRNAELIIATRHRADLLVVGT